MSSFLIAYDALLAFLRVAFRRQWENASDPDAFLAHHAAVLREAARPWASCRRGAGAAAGALYGRLVDRGLEDDWVRSMAEWLSVRVSSSEALRTYWPSGVTATAVTLSACPSRERSSVPVPRTPP